MARLIGHQGQSGMFKGEIPQLHSKGSVKTGMAGQPAASSNLLILIRAVASFVDIMSFTSDFTQKPGAIPRIFKIHQSQSL